MSADAVAMKPLLSVVAGGQTLSAEEAAAAFEIIMSGDATAAQIGAFLMALGVRGETVEEIAAAAQVMRDKALRIEAPAGAVDTVGTGGDASGTYNVSTASAFVVAAAGVPVAKHGNRALSSKSGAADVLTALGINIDCDMALVRAALWEVGICFLMAPRHHSAMRHVGPARVELGTRTVFNLLGPLANPAMVDRLLVGVFAREWVEPVAHVLARLGASDAWVVHGSDGLDEITTTGPSHVAALRGGEVSCFDIAPGDVGLALATPNDLKGGDPTDNAAALTAVLEGAAGPYRDIVLMNAGATLVVAGKVDDLAAGVALARDRIDSGAARAKLADLVAITNRPA